MCNHFENLCGGPNDPPPWVRVGIRVKLRFGVLSNELNVQLSHIYFIWYHPESGWYVTRRNQGLSLGREWLKQLFPMYKWNNTYTFEL